MIKYLIHP